MHTTVRGFGLARAIFRGGRTWTFGPGWNQLVPHPMTSSEAACVWYVPATEIAGPPNTKVLEVYLFEN